MAINIRLLSENIKVERMLQGLTQQDLAKRLNINPSRLCNWEKGYRTPSIENLLLISVALKISIADLVRGVYEDQSGV